MDMEEFPFLKISNRVRGIFQVDVVHRDILFTYLPHCSPQVTTAAVSQIIRASVWELGGCQLYGGQ